MGHGVGDWISNQLRQCLRCVLRPNSLGNAERRQADHALQRTENHDTHHESRHACAGGVCSVNQTTDQVQSNEVER